MNAGRLECAGSASFLKEKYGTGFILEVDVANKDNDLSSLEQLLGEKADGHSFNLPKTLSSKFSDLFSEID